MSCRLIDLRNLRRFSRFGLRIQRSRRLSAEMSLFISKSEATGELCSCNEWLIRSGFLKSHPLASR